MIHHYFIKKETKVHFIMAVFNLVMFSMPLFGILALWAGILNYLTGPKYDKIQDALGDLPARVGEFDVSLVVVSIGLLYLIIFILQKTLVKKVKKSRFGIR